MNHHTITSDPSSSPPPSSGRPPDPPASEEDQLAFTPAAIKNLWNETCPSMPQVTEVTATRFRHLKARSGLKLDKLKQVFEMVEESDFLTGRIGGPKPWATLDWLIKPNNWAKVQEGNYRPRKGESVVDKKPLKEYF